ncbi:MAG: hypothetical protein PHR06_09780 [Candidatus Cloacimonetes bacterium]|nr:hypothetical protein [Candidatus Cloacimonadota bacterium]
MPGKQLNLRLFYKDNHIDTAVANRDFSSKLFMGKGKDTFWQIADQKFPEKYLFLSKKGSDYVVNLQKGMSFTIKKNDNVMSENEVKSSMVLNGNRLLVKEGTEGNIDIGNEWAIQYSYVPVREASITPQQKMLIKEYGRRSELTAQEKFTRNFLILGVFLTLVGILLFDTLYQPIVIDQALRLRSYDTALATPVTTKPIYTQPTEPAEEAPEAEVVQETETPTTTEKTTAAVSAVDFQSNFGFDPNAGISQSQINETKFLQVQVAQAIVSSDITGTQTGTSKSKSGKGSGPGSSKSGSGEGFKLDGLDVKPNTENLNLNELMSTSEFKDITSGSNLKDVGDYSTFMGKTGGLEKIEITKMDNQKKFLEDVKKMGSQLQRIEEKQIEAETVTGTPTSSQQEVRVLREKIRSYQNQLTQAFNKYSLTKKVYGTVLFEILIVPGGKISSINYDISKDSKLPDDFIIQCVDIIKEWKIDVSKPTIYPLRMNFMDI